MKINLSLSTILNGPNYEKVYKKTNTLRNDFISDK